MSTLTFDSTNAAIIFDGFKNDAGSEEYVPGDSGFRVVATGTQCEVNFVDLGGPYGFDYSIDGGAFHGHVTPGTGYYSLFSGLSDGPHTVVFRGDAFAAWVKSGMLRVTGAAPAISAVPGYTNTVYPVGGGLSYISNDNCVPTGANSGYPSTQMRGLARFRATTSIIRVWGMSVGDANRQFASLIIDGDPASMQVVAVPTRGGGIALWDYYSFTGLDGANEHEYILAFNYNNYNYSVQFPGGTINTTPITPYPAAFFDGDSITDGSTIANGDCTNFPVIYGVLAKRGWQVDGTQFASLYVQGQGKKTDAKNASPVPVEFFSLYGTNDINQTLQAETLANYRSALDDVMSEWTTDFATAPLRFVGIINTTFNQTGGAHGNRDDYNAEITAAIAANGASNLKYISSDSWGHIEDGGDGVHPDAAGALVIGTKLAAAMASANGLLLLRRRKAA